MKQNSFTSIEDVVSFITESFTYLQTARPTAVNISEAAVRFSKEASELSKTTKNPNELVSMLYESLSKMLDEDVATNRSIGCHGAQHILSNHCTAGGRQAVILTHCNTGSLASGGYGTALGKWMKMLIRIKINITIIKI